MLLLAIVAGISQAALPALEKPHDWVVKDHVVPQPVLSGGELGWSHIHCLGYFGNGARSTVFSEGFEQSVSVGAEVFRITKDFPTEQLIEVFIDYNDPKYNFYFPSRGYISPLIGLLKAPDGLRVAMATSGNRAPWIPIRHLASGQSRGWLVPPPPPQPGLPAAQVFEAIHNAGDVNQDGYDDVVFESHNGANIFGLMDGRTLQAVWQHYEYPMAGYAPIYFMHFGVPSDLDGDMVPDFVRGSLIYDLPFTGVYRQVVVAISGTTGVTLWRREFPVFGSPSGIWGPDVTGDGKRDVLVLATSTWDLLDGATGATIWSLPKAELAPLLEPGWQGYGAPDFGGTVAIPSVSGDGHRFIVPMRAVYPFSVEFHHVELHASTGRIVGLATMPRTNTPWSADRLLTRILNLEPASLPCGDIDGDGLLEIAVQAFAEDLDVPGTSVMPVQFVFLGPRTLSLPEQADTGSEIRGSLWIPSSPGLKWLLFASTSFDRGGGHLLDGWRTGLGASPLLTTTLAQPAAVGILDSKGKADIRVDLNRWPLTPGQTIYWKAMVLEPGSQDSAKTATSLAMTEILP